MFKKFLGLAMIAGGSALFLSGCQSTGQYTPPTYVAPTPSFAPPALQHYSGPPPIPSGPSVETAPPPLAPEPKKMSAPISTKPGVPPKPERIA